MPWYLYLALKQLFASGQRKFFTGISMLSVALGVALMIVVLSVMGGFASEIHKMTQDTQGDVQVRASGAIANAAQLQAVLEKIPGVESTTAFAQGEVMVKFDDKPTFPTIQGIDVNTVAKVIPINDHLIAGTLDDLDDDSIILSSKLALSIGARMGSKVEVYSPVQFTKMADGSGVALPTELSVVGIFQIGHQLLDSSTVIVTLRRMQDLYELGTAVHGVDLKIAPNLDADQETYRINMALRSAQGPLLPKMDGLEARSWKEINASFLYAIQLEKNIQTLIMLIVIVVAAFLTMCLLLVLVFKKTREIGLLGALGATRRGIAMCFCVQGLAIGVVGMLLGLGLGFTILYFRNDILHFLTQMSGTQAALENVYQFSDMPAHTNPGDLILIIVAAIVLSTLAGVIPATVAARLKPVEALRNE